MADDDERGWTTAGLADTARVLEELSGSALTSLLMTVMARRAGRRSPAEALRQWERDTFTGLSVVDLRQVLRAELRLLDAAVGFEAVELSPLAPCASVAPGSQNRVVTTVRGTEVMSDTTNVMALECARRLRAEVGREVRLATCARVVRGQPVPKGPGYAHHFKIFALATAGREREEHGFLIDAVVEQVQVLCAGIDALADVGVVVRRRPVRLLTTPAREEMGRRIAAGLGGLGISVERGGLEHSYYHGVRFGLDVEGPEGRAFNLADGGAFDWVARLTANRRLVFVASGLGTQLAVAALR